MRYSVLWLGVPLAVGVYLVIGHGVTAAGVAIALVVLGSLGPLVRRAAAFRARARAVTSLVDSTEDAVIGTTPQGIITSWNRGAESIYGWAAADVMGWPLETIVPPSTRTAVATSMQQLARGTPAIRHQALGLHRDGHEIDVALTVCPVYSRGRLTGVSTIARDISAAVAAEAERERLLGELEEQNEQLRELDRMKDEFVASVSHELRTPLTSIRGYLELVREDGTLSEENELMLGIVDRNAERLLSLVNDLLFAAQVAAGDRVNLVLEQIDLADIVTEAVAAAEPRAELGGVTLLADVGPAAISCDQMRIGQVVDNLISNAIKFTPSGGTVRVNVRAGDDTATLSVCDSGRGIAEDEQAELFSRFYRTPGARTDAIQGTGLGLSIVKSIVDAHSGSVTFDSAVGVGTTFTVTLPQAAAVVVRDPA